MRAVVFALMMREMKTRFGIYRLGYLWALLEPAIHIAVFAVIFGYIAQRTMPGINFVVFLTTGIIPWLMFNVTVHTPYASIGKSRCWYHR